MSVDLVIIAYAIDIVSNVKNSLPLVGQVVQWVNLDSNVEKLGEIDFHSRKPARSGLGT